MRLTIRWKIILGSLGTVGMALGLVAFLVLGQRRSLGLMRQVLEENLAAMTVAEDIKHSFVLYDDMVFRYIATNDPVILEESLPIKHQGERSLERMKSLVKGETEKKLVSEVQQEIEDYHRDTFRILDTYKTLEEKQSVLNLVARGDDRDQPVKFKKLKEAYTGTMLSAKGRARLERIHGGCDKLLEIKRADLEESQKRMETALKDGERSSLIASLGLAAGTSVIALLLAMSIAGPIHRLLGGVRRISDGNWGEEIPVRSHDEVGELTRAFNAMTRLLSQEREKLITETITDQLTNLYNFRHFQKELKDEVSRSARYKHPFGLLVLDIDHFKGYNDAHGHPHGNALLVQLAKLLRETLRREDFLARYGGEEFVVILPEADAKAAQITAERLRSVVASTSFPLEKTQPGGKLTVSIGGAVYPEDGLSAEILLENADQSLYKAKKEGRNKVCFHPHEQAAA